MVANWVVDLNFRKATAPLSTMAIFLAVVGIVCLSRGSKGTPRSLTFKDYKKSFVSIILGGARMLGSTMFPCAMSASIRIEDYLTFAFIASGLVLSIIAYDYQEVGVVVTLYFLFRAIVALIMPLLAKLRTVYLEAGFFSGEIPSDDGEFNDDSSCCLYLLKRLGKQPYRNWHKL